jgi:uncharacterized membrane protein
MTMTTMRSPSRKIGYALGTLGLLGLLAGTALAEGKAGKGGHFKAVSMKFGQAMEAIQATPEQRATLDAAQKQVLEAMKQARQQGKQHRAHALAGFEQDQFDLTAVQQARAAAQARMLAIQQAKDAFLKTAHGALNPEQRKAFVAFVRANGDIFHARPRRI